jgi:sulfate adenylyltransferase large subunit
VDHVELLRFSTCGSVDDGKSTLIGRLLYDSKQLLDDQMAALERAAMKSGEFNLANLTDGLRAEREQGITIDVAYRYFATPRRRFIVADTPGHVQYTRNMVTGASTANLAIILIDARKGVIEQTRRHSYLASLLGIPHLVVCVNKMDLVDFSEEVFTKIRNDFDTFATRLNIKDITFVPASALNGDNVVTLSERTPWYHGPPLLGFLENVHIANDANLIDPRFAVQWVVRPRSDEHHDYRGFAGLVNSGVFRVGETVIALPSGQRSRIKAIKHHERDLAYAFARQSVTILLEDEIDLSRGDMLVRYNNIPFIGGEIEAMLCWMNQAPLQLGRKYVLKHTANTTKAIVKELEYRVNIETLEQEPGLDKLRLNEIGRVTLKTLKPLLYDDYRRNRATGAFILVDELTNATVAAGMIREPRVPPPMPEFTDYVI